MSAPDFSEGCAWIEGEYVPINDARIPITDPGFSRSDVTYDVAAVWKGKFFRLEDHLDRFERSMAKLHMKLDVDRDQMREILHRCVQLSGLRDSYVDMIATRGGLPKTGGRDPRTYQNRFYAYAIPYIWIVDPAQTSGTDLVVARETIRIPVESVDPTIKNFHWGDLVRATFEAYERGGKHPILLDRDGYVTEGPGFNIFAINDGTLYTPDKGVLEGVTRRTVIELAEREGLSVLVRAIKEDVLRSAEELFLTSTAGGVMPVKSLDGVAFENGVPGPVTQRLRDLYWQAHDELPWAVPVEYSVTPA